MQHFHIFFKPAAANAQKCNAVAVGLVHVGLYFKHERRKILVHRVNVALGAVARQRRSGQPQKVLQKRLHAKVGQRAAKEHRRQPRVANFVHVKIVACAVQQFNVLCQLRVRLGADLFVQVRVAQLRLHRGQLVLAAQRAAALAPIRENLRLLAVVYTLKLLAAANGPVHRVGADAEFLLNVLQQVKRVHRLAVHLINKGKNGDVAQQANLKQFFGLLLHALCRIDHHHGAVGRHQRAVGIL
ncbi:hypothetical protein SDC9_91281 [bioreactor metagenome]|uniref:Uncharacterized protein n=1 Tax=bioreactor metagenome TaxID=1076179 RepID=A0A644ZUT2_9ZZZZ